MKAMGAMKAMQAKPIVRRSSMEAKTIVLPMKSMGVMKAMQAKPIVRRSSMKARTIVLPIKAMAMKTMKAKKATKNNEDDEGDAEEQLVGFRNTMQCIMPLAEACH